MPIVTTELMVGPGKLWRAPVGTADADIVLAAVPDWTDWEDFGPTDGGLQLTIAKSYAQHSVDQSPDYIASTITDRNARIETSLVAITLQNLQAVLNGGTITTGINWDTYQPDTDLIATQEEYSALAIEGNTLGGKKAIFVVRRALNVDNVGSAFQKDGKTMLGANWSGHFVSESIAPFVFYQAK